jgi:RND family efflux transporter MFP subunit
MKLKLAAIAILTVVGIGAIAFVIAPSGSADDTTYLTAPVERGDVNDEVAATGTVATTAVYGLAFGTPARLIEDAEADAPTSQTTWPVAEVSVAVGDAVSRDQVLAMADTADLQRELDIAIAEWRAAGNDLALAEADRDEAEDDGTSEEKRRARSAYYSAKARFDRTRQERAELVETIAGATITSPVEGIVTDVAITAGTDAPSGDAITVAAPGLEVETDVVEGDVASVSVGQQATVTIDAIGGEVAGTVSAIGLEPGEGGQSSVVSYPVTIALLDVPETVRPGMTAEVTIVTATAADVLSVPTSALEGGPESYTVQVMGADGVPVGREVTVGLVTEARAEIASGLSEGEIVVTGTLSEQQLQQRGFGSGGFGGPGGGGGGRVIQGGPAPTGGQD